MILVRLLAGSRSNAAAAGDGAEAGAPKLRLHETRVALPEALLLGARELRLRICIEHTSIAECGLRF